MGAPVNSKVAVNMIYGSANRVSTPSQYPPQTRVTPINRRVSESGIPVVFRFQAPLTGYRMDGYIYNASGFVLCL